MRKKGNGKKWVAFGIECDPKAEVFVAGSFNEWASDQIQLNDRGGSGSYQVRILLPPGRHEYKFVVNGSWVPDPRCDEWVPNRFGTLNSVVEVA